MTAGRYGRRLHGSIAYLTPETVAGTRTRVRSHSIAISTFATM